VRYRIGKSWLFSAAHRLPQLPTTHPCHRLHGHNYTVEVVLVSGVLNEQSFVLDYGEMDVWMGGFLKATLDHRNLNDVLGEVPPTAENLARWLFDMFTAQDAGISRIESVTVRETPTTWATYTYAP
jgi:6-pyruvoyltetrahydropterin/6-carboxytetrahydropterin synthase